jgi:hypothetical protein
MPPPSGARLDLYRTLAAGGDGATSMLRRSLSMLVLLGICLCMGEAVAQTTTATLQGTARDVTGAVLQGVTIVVRSPDTGVTRVAATDATGRFYVAALPVGRYNVTAELTGFKKETWPDVRLEVGQEAALDFALQIGSVEENVTVKGAPPAVSITKTAIDQVVRREQIDMLPISNRTVANLALLAPGVVPQSALGEPVTAGAQPRGSIEILVDGVSNKGTTLGNNRSNVPPDAVEEFQVQTSQYSAEFGNASGIVLHTITRSGTNQFHGRVYYFQRDDGLDARNAFATTTSAFEQKQGGGWLGGPILVDRTHFFGSVEITKGVAVATVNAYSEKGDVEQPFHNENLFVRVDHQLTPGNRLTGRVLVDRPFRENEGVGGINTASRAYDLEKHDYAFVAALSTQFTSRALNELRVQYSDAFLEGLVDNPDAYIEYRPTSLTGKADGMPRGGTERRVQVVDSFSYVAGPHRLKFGFDISRVSISSYWWLNLPGTYSFSDDRPFDPNDSATYPATFTKNLGGVTYSETIAANVSVFAQDSWLVHPTVTLNLGVRYDAYSMTGLDLQTVNLGPRLGVAWGPLRDGKTVVRGGFGVFYNSILANIADVSVSPTSSQRIQVNNPGYPDPFSTGQPQKLSGVRAQGNVAVPRTYTASIGVQRQFGSDWAVSVDYVNMKGRHLIRQVETNPTLPAGSTWVRQDPTLGFQREEQSSGYSNYQAMWAEVRKRWGARAQVRGAYTLASGKATNDLEAQFVQQDDRYPDDAYGYTNNDERHRVAVDGTVFLPRGVQVGAVMYARSGRPVNVIIGKDVNKNGSTLDRPNLAPGVKVGTDAMRDSGSYVPPAAGTLGDLPRNAGRGPGFWQLDIRVSKVILVGRARVEVLAEAFNVDNHVNLNNWISNLQSAEFGVSKEAGPARQVQLGLRVSF